MSRLLHLDVYKRQVCCGERGSFNGELTANESVSERLISFSCDCGLYSVPNIAEAVVMDLSLIHICMKKLNAFKYWHRIKRCVCGDCLATIVNFMVSCIFPLSGWQINFALKLI